MSNRKRVEGFLRQCRRGGGVWFSVTELARCVKLRPSQVGNVLSNNRGDYQRKVEKRVVSGWRWRLEGEDETEDGDR